MNLDILKNNEEAMSKIQEMLNDFCDFTGLAAVITDTLGNKLSSLSKFSDFCLEMRKCDDLCCNSDRLGGILAARIQDTCIYTCHAGIVDFAVPIIVDGEHIGTILAGQVRTDKKLLIDFREKNNSWISDESMVRKYNTIPSMGHEKLLKSAKILNILANYIKEKILSYSNTLPSSNTPESFKSNVELIISEISKVNYNKSKNMIIQLVDNYIHNSFTNLKEYRDIFNSSMSTFGIYIPSENELENYNECSFIGNQLSGSYYFKLFDYIFEKIILQKRFRKISDFDWVTQYCNRFFYKKITTQDMAKYINISNDYFSRQFKKHTGITFTEFFTRIKLREAKRLMTTSDLSILTISLELGYLEANYFARVFKKYEGLTPRDFREKNNRIV